MAASEEANGNGVKINRTVFSTIVALIIVAMVLALAGWAWGQAGHATQETHLTKYDGEIATLDPRHRSDHRETGRDSE